MSTTVSKPESDFEQVPEGTFIARCYSLIFLGTQPVNYKGETKYREKVSITWELLDDEGKMKDGKPFVISKMYTRTLDDRGDLHSDLVAWRGKRFTTDELASFDLSNIVGAYANLQVIHNTSEATGKTYSNVTALMPYKGDKPKPVNENIIFEIDEPDAAVFNKLSDYYKNKIQAAPEFKAPKGAMLNDPNVPAKQVEKIANQSDDVIITDLDENAPINLDDIPF